MSAIREIADGKLHDIVYGVMSKYHPDLKSAGIKVTVFLVKFISRSGEILDNEPVLKSNGHGASATIRRASKSELQLGSGDVIIEIDSFVWREHLREKSRVALIDHELCHIGLRRNKNGKIRMNPNGRPAIELIHHDIEIGLFYDVVKRHGKDSIEIMLSNSMFVGIHKAMGIFEDNKNNNFT
ncbi:MAG: putative metallopeptidase [Candidatus Fermentibacteria bacterium]|nr:putative metallopeptidase [Candidatus Fermentibacteria bacterium]